MPLSNAELLEYVDAALVKCLKTGEEFHISDTGRKISLKELRDWREQLIAGTSGKPTNVFSVAKFQTAKV